MGEGNIGARRRRKECVNTKVLIESDFAGEEFEAELRELCDIYVEATESIVICLLWNTFVHILELDLDPEMKMVHAIAADVAEKDGPIAILKRLVAALGEHDRVKSQEGVSDLFSHLRSLIGISTELSGRKL